MRPKDHPSGPEGAALTGVLRRSLILLISLVIAASAIIVATVGNLDRQIGYWAQIEELDTLRERLLASKSGHFAAGRDADTAVVVAAFDALARQVETLQATNSNEAEFNDQADRFVTEARRLFVAENEQKLRILQQFDQIDEHMDDMQNVAGGWATARDDMEQDIAAEAEAIDAQQRQLNRMQANLTVALLAAQRIQRQIVAAGRLANTSSGELAAAATSALNSDELPTPCTQVEMDSPEKICSPSVVRVRSSLARLRDAAPEEFDQLPQQALWALEGYVRAGELRYHELSEQLAETIDKGRITRRKLAEARNAATSLGRINRVLLQLDTTLQDASNGGVGLEDSRPIMGSLLPQLRFRMIGLINQSPFINGDVEEIERMAGAVSESWSQLDALLTVQDRYLLDFEREVIALSSAISAKADKVRASTTLWVNIFASIALTGAALLVICVIAGFELARRKILAPLSSVTNTILGLSLGELDRPIALKETAFGFEHLGQALEQLRAAMSERNALAERNADQRDVIEQNMRALEQSSREMEWLAMHDPLTGLGNRRNADADLAALTQRCKQNRQDFCLIHLDVDRFKEINDALGHDAGDHILKSVAAVLKDISGTGAACYRIGGDEFLLALDGDLRAKRVERLCTKIIRELERPIDYRGHACRAGVSMGIAFGKDADFDAATTLINADLALIEAKRDGRKLFRFYTDGLQSLSRQRKEMSDLLLDAIDAEAFEPYYQPQFYADGLHLRGVETLCRWQDPVRGWIAPAEFLPIAEDLKVVGEIDQILFRKVARDVRRIEAMDLSLPKVSFNMTADRLLQTNLADELSNFGTGQTRIAVELLESMSLDSLSDSVRWAIDSLKERGIEIEIDDFGSCRASVAGLIAVGPDAMKIDRDIIAPLAHSAQHLKLVKAIIEIGRALKIEVVAEGVETEAHTETLRQLGCDVLQGFGLARPMALDQLIELLRDEKIREGQARAV